MALDIRPLTTISPIAASSMLHDHDPWQEAEEDPEPDLLELLGCLLIVSIAVVLVGMGLASWWG